jgi:hypothetical protein
MKVVTVTDDITLKIEDCGALFLVTEAQTITLPNAIVPVGWNVKIIIGGDATVVIDPKPDTSGFYIKGALQAAGKYISMTDIGDFVELVWDGTNWIAANSLSGADGDITVEG